VQNSFTELRFLFFAPVSIGINQGHTDYNGTEVTTSVHNNLSDGSVFW
jgi:hypothetical protein